MVIGLSGVQFVIYKSLHSYDSRPNWTTRCPVTTTIDISEGKKCILFCERAFKTNYPKLEKISLAQTLSNVTNSSTLENPQFGGVRGRCYGYFDNFCDWWTSLSTLNMIG